MALSFDDSNAFRWSARKTAEGYTLTVERDAPYRRRALTAPSTMTEKEIRALVEASVAIPERVAPSKPPAKPPAKRKPSSKDGAGWLILIVIGVLALSKKGR